MSPEATSTGVATSVAADPVEPPQTAQKKREFNTVPVTQGVEYHTFVNVGTVEPRLSEP